MWLAGLYVNVERERKYISYTSRISTWMLPILNLLGNRRFDYEIEAGGEIIKFLSLRSTQRASGTRRPQIGARLEFKTKHETAQFVRAGESEGFTFSGKEFIARY